jgi:hypothetical protein
VLKHVLHYFQPPDRDRMLPQYLRAFKALHPAARRAGSMCSALVFASFILYRLRFRTIARNFCRLFGLPSIRCSMR